MRGGSTFADVLDATLGTCTEVPSSPRPSSNRPITPPLFIFGDVHHHVPSASYESERTAEAAPDRTPEPPADWTREAEAEPVRASAPLPRTPAPPPLTPREQRALDALNELGANLCTGVSAADLRRAFRRLAHRYHPDRHPGSSRADQQRLARLFADMTDHYRLLAAALDASATLH